MAATSANLYAAASLIRTGNCRAIWVGDSTAAPANTPRWIQGIVKKWRVTWNGFFIPPLAYVPDESAETYFAVPTLINPGATLSDGTINETAMLLGEYVFPGPVGAFGAVYSFRHSTLTNFLNGDWAKNSALVARFMTQMPSVGTPWATQSLTVTRSGVIEIYPAFAFGTLAGRASINIAFGASTGVAAAFHGIAYSAANSGEDETGKYFTTYGHLLRATGVVNGFSLVSISYGGWSTTTHLATITQSHIQNTSALLYDDHPNLIFIALGTNFGTGEGDSDYGQAQYKANIEALITRWTAGIVAAGGAIPKFILVNTWEAHAVEELNPTSGFADRRAAALEQIAWSNPDNVATCNIDQLVKNELGPFSAWQATLLSDGIHQTILGTETFARLFDEEIQSALDAAIIAPARPRTPFLKLAVRKLRKTLERAEGIAATYTIGDVDYPITVLKGRIEQVDSPSTDADVYIRAQQQSFLFDPSLIPVAPSRGHTIAIPIDGGATSTIYEVAEVAYRDSDVHAEMIRVFCHKRGTD